MIQTKSLRTTWQDSEIWRTLSKFPKHLIHFQYLGKKLHLVCLLIEPSKSEQLSLCDATTSVSGFLKAHRAKDKLRRI